ncbi:hypothetical protein HF521_022636 [Silurus meridionalis]|uniref:Receptor-type tyrosine-protein phosphatase C n=1 Tax=Silurus meridionalis TaxID=175797 RepID=A0A8T0BAF4_SILME|nr:hypothetical protein HF521_022636 [Silurus meridionalis]
MAKFRGPRFLLLVLAGLLLSFVYGKTNQSIPTSSSDKPASNSITINPTSITLQGNENGKGDTANNGNGNGTTTGNPDISTTASTQKISPPRIGNNTTAKNTVLPTNISTQQHTNVTTIKPDISTTASTQTISPARMADKTADNSTTASTNITTSPPLISNRTTEKPHTCIYTLKEENNSLKVTINSSDPGAQYNFIFKGQSHNYNVIRSSSFSILFKSFKPCQKYNITVKPFCTPTSDRNFFETRILDKKDVTPTLKTDPKVEVCFETIWNLAKCIPIDSKNSCKNESVTFNENTCPNTTGLYTFTLPPEKPEIIFENKIPTSLEWKNKLRCEDNLTYTCKDSQSNDVAVEALEPFTNYKCTGTYNSTLYFGGLSSTINLYIKCDLNKPSISVNSTNIFVSWNFESKKCSDLIYSRFTLETKCNKTILETSCTQNSCVVSSLSPWTYYHCDIIAKYNNLSFQTLKEQRRTQASKPLTPNVIKAHTVSHNSFHVSCHIDNWHGDPGEYTAQLCIDKDCQDPRKHKNCNFKFDNLYYLTTYEVKIYGKNGQGNESEIISKTFSTSYNDKAILGILGFLIVVTTVALLFVLYKIYILKREKSRNEQEMDDLLPANTLIPVEPMSADALLEAYKRKRADEGRLFMEEFQSVPRIFSNYSVREAKKTENQSKNRYIDILPYDYNRVILSHGETNDYINASFIEGYKESNKYIAAQGPKEETMADFWTMIWEQKTSIIVMVTRCEEGNKNKCAQYWPSLERETEIFDDLVVKIKGEENCPNYIIRHLTMMNRREKSAEREVTHIQFTSWPDHGVPSDPGLLLKLRRRVNSFKNFFSGPIVIHCSAGVGRTGTYIGIDAMIESLEAEGRVDIYGYVVKLRRQRCLMVQVEAQYVLIHTALIEYSQFGETEMSLSNFHSEVNTLRQKDGNESSLIEMEFQKLPRFKNYRASNAARTEENKKKNRSSVIPYDFNRVSIKVEDESSHESDADDEEEYSSDEEDDALTKYINASYVDGYWSPNSFIVAQGPMADTVADFLQMLYQKKVKSVFMLSDCTENDMEFCSQYWDDEKKTFGEMTVEVKETENFPTYIRRCLEIQHTKRKDSHTLQQYHFLKWTGLELPANPLELIDMMKSIRQSSDSSKVENLPTVAHCNDGSSRSGIFCALWKLLDSADTEKLVDIFQVVKDLRKSRLGMINTVEQYEFLYTALEAAYPMQNGEVKKPSEAPADSVQVVNESTALITPSTDAVTTESAQESTDPAPPEEGTTEAKTEPEKAVSESTTNGPTTTVEV